MKDKAVSPVIGVLLMLTLTLLIVAIVNSYAGGLVEVTPKPPSVNIQAHYSQSGGMDIRHISGDQIPVQSVRLVVRPSESFGRDGTQFSSEVNKQYITNATGQLSWDNITTSMIPGDIYYIRSENLSHLQDISNSNYWFNKSTDPDNRGKTFNLEVYYKNTLISDSEVLIEG